MSNKTTKCRIVHADNELLKISAVRLSAEMDRMVKTSEVIHALIQSSDECGNAKVDSIIKTVRPYIEPTN